MDEKELEPAVDVPDEPIPTYIPLPEENKEEDNDERKEVNHG